MLITKYRPTSFDDFIGDFTSLKSLKKVLSKDNPPKSYLITGSAGSGKTTLARILKESLHCSDTAFIELNGSSERGIDVIRNLTTSAMYVPLHGQNKMIFIDEAHQLTKEAQEALLKATEDSTPNTYWVFCTTEPQAIKNTLQRRQFIINIPPLEKSALFDLLRRVIKGEGLDKSKYPKALVERLCELSQGSPGKLLQLFESVYLLDSAEEMMAHLEDGIEITSEAEWVDICRILIKNDSPQIKWKAVSRAIQSMKANTDFESGRRVALAYFSTVLMSTGNPMHANILNNFLTCNLASAKGQFILACYKSCAGV